MYLWLKSQWAGEYPQYIQSQQHELAFIEQNPKLILHRFLRNWYWSILRKVAFKSLGIRKKNIFHPLDLILGLTAVLTFSSFLDFLIIVPRAYKRFIHPSIHSAEDVASILIHWFSSIFKKICTKTISQNPQILFYLGLKEKKIVWANLYRLGREKFSTISSK